MLSLLKYKNINYSTLQLPERVHINLNKNAKRLALRLDNKSKSIRYTVPKGTSLSKAQSFIDKNYEWVIRCLESLPSDIILTDNCSFPYFGQEITIKVKYEESLKVKEITLNDTNLTIKTASEIYGNRLRRWIINDFKRKVNIMSKEKAATIGKEIKGVKTSDTKTRWGSCSHEGKLCFSWRLAFAPLEAIDYVVAHEVAHLNHMDHSKSFWALCQDLSHDYKAGKKWMKENGSELMRYVFPE